MATYLPGMTDYIPQNQPFVPDFNFLGNVLQTKQSRYDKAHKQISSLYGSILNAPLSREENIAKRDAIFKQINNDIQRLSGLDLSLQQNIDFAKSVFDPITDDKDILKDMQWTKNYNQEMDRAESFKMCTDPDECGGEYWDIGVQALQLKRMEFMQASTEEARNFQNVSYTPYQNLTRKAHDLLKELDYKMTYDESDGKYIITNINGEAVTKPVLSYLKGVFGNDPSVMDMFKTRSYVSRKNWVQGNLDNYGGDEQAANNAYVDLYIEQLEKAAQERQQAAEQEQQNAQTQQNAVEQVAQDGIDPRTDASYIDNWEEAMNQTSTADANLDVENRAVADGARVRNNRNNPSIYNDAFDGSFAHAELQAALAGIAADYALLSWSATSKADPYGLKSMQLGHDRWKFQEQHGYYENGVYQPGTAVGAEIAILNQRNTLWGGNTAPGGSSRGTGGNPGSTPGGGNPGAGPQIPNYNPIPLRPNYSPAQDTTATRKYGGGYSSRVLRMFQGGGGKTGQGSGSYEWFDYPTLVPYAPNRDDRDPTTIDPLKAFAGENPLTTTAPFYQPRYVEEIEGESFGTATRSLGDNWAQERNQGESKDQLNSAHNAAFNYLSEVVKELNKNYRNAGSDPSLSEKRDIYETLLRSMFTQPRTGLTGENQLYEQSGFDNTESGKEFMNLPPEKMREMFEWSLKNLDVQGDGMYNKFSRATLGGWLLDEKTDDLRVAAIQEYKRYDAIRKYNVEMGMTALNKSWSAFENNIRENTAPYIESMINPPGNREGADQEYVNQVLDGSIAFKRELMEYMINNSQYGGYPKDIEEMNKLAYNFSQTNNRLLNEEESFIELRGYPLRGGNLTMEEIAQKMDLEYKNLFNLNYNSSAAWDQHPMLTAISKTGGSNALSTQAYDVRFDHSKIEEDKTLKSVYKSIFEEQYANHPQKDYMVQASMNNSAGYWQRPLATNIGLQQLFDDWVTDVERVTVPGDASSKFSVHEKDYENMMREYRKWLYDADNKESGKIQGDFRYQEIAFYDPEYTSFTLTPDMRFLNWWMTKEKIGKDEDKKAFVKKYYQPITFGIKAKNAKNVFHQAGELTLTDWMLTQGDSNPLVIDYYPDGGKVQVNRKGDGEYSISGEIYYYDQDGKFKKTPFNAAKPYTPGMTGEVIESVLAEQLKALHYANIKARINAKENGLKGTPVEVIEGLQKFIQEDLHGRTNPR